MISADALKPATAGPTQRKQSQVATMPRDSACARQDARDSAFNPTRHIELSHIEAIETVLVS